MLAHDDLQNVTHLRMRRTEEPNLMRPAGVEPAAFSFGG